MKFTKEQQMLGMWADYSEEERSKTSIRGSSERPRNLYEISFVAGEIQQAGKLPQDNKMDQDEEDQDVFNTSSDSEREEAPSQTSSINTNALFKGIGAKLLFQMGYKPGKGLGKSLQGITVPVEAQIRRGRGAIGAYGPERSSKVSQKKDANIEKPKKFKVKLSKWRKTDETKKTKYLYKSVDQVLKDGKFKTSSSDMSRVKVIDMTGPEQRIFSGYHAIANQYHHDESFDKLNKKSFTNFVLPELQHNLNLIIDMCEQNIIQNYKKTQHLSDKGLALEAEKKNIEKVIEQHDQLIHTLDTVVNIIENFLANNHEMSLDETAETFKRLQDQYNNNYMAYELEKLASSFVIPKLASFIARWNPLVELINHLDSIKQWKEILSMRNNLKETRSPYYELILNAWIPPVQRAIQQWNCREPDLLINFFEIWMPLIPKIIMDGLKMSVLQKLTIEVAEWEPKTDISIYLWIHPWLPLLGDNINSDIYPIIRRKLPSASTQQQIKQKLMKVMPTAPRISLSFKDLVQKKCAERDIIFIPMGNRDQEGNQLYKIGNFQAFINDDVLYVKQESNWNPTSLNDLLNMSQFLLNTLRDPQT